ncbi:MAG: peptidylprolyl isomerase [Deltaproteobacteria bacterium]|nr:peptidylprolyl isomerase [Deltaproteobacteria bacterium]
MRNNGSLLYMKSLLFIGILLLGGCKGKAPREEEKALAKVGMNVITLTEFEESFSSTGKRYASNYPMDRKNSLKLKAAYLNQLIEEKLIMAEAEKMKINVGMEEIDATIAELKKNYGDDNSFKKVFIDEHLDLAVWREKVKKKLLVEKVIYRTVSSKVDISDEEIKDYYENNLDEFHSDEKVKAKQIFHMDEREASKARERVRAGEDFAAVAMDVSQSPDASEGGDLGYFGRGIMPPEFDETVFTMEVGSLSEVVRSSYGYHIFLLEDRREERDLSFEDVKEKIAEVIRRNKEEHIYGKWIDGLREKTNIEINHELLQRSILLR